MYYDVENYEMGNEDLESIIDRKIKGSFLWMTLGLVLTFSMILLNMNVHFFAEIFFRMYRITLILQLILAVVLALVSYSASATVLKVLFLTYAFVTGQTLTLFAFIYDTTSIMAVLFGTIVLFAILAIYGYTTTNKLLSYKTFLTVGLISLVVLSLINIFLRSETLYLFLSFLGVIVFVIYTAYDTYVIKNNIIELVNSGRVDLLDRIEIVGAFALYLDFINLFINLLRIFGKRRR